MDQIAKIVETDGEYAIVEVSRKTACDMCHSASGSEKCEACMAFGEKNVTARVSNVIGAAPGDLVRVSASSGRIIGYSAAIFVLPIIAAIACYAISSYFVSEKATPIALGVFAAVFALSCIVLERKVKHDPDLKAVEILTHEHDNR